MCHPTGGNLMAAETLDGVGIRHRVTIGAGKRLYIIATKDTAGRVRVTWTMPAENRRADYHGRRISPVEGRQLKTLIRSIVEQL